MQTRLVALGRWLFPERQFLLRSGERLHCVSMPGWIQACMVVVAIGLVGGVGGLIGAYHNLHRAMHRKEAEISAAAARDAADANLRRQLAAADQQYFAMTDQFDAMQHQLDAAVAENNALHTAIGSAETRVVLLDKDRDTLKQRLQKAEAALHSKTGNLAALDGELAGSRAALNKAELARASLQHRLQELEADSEHSHSRTHALKLALEARENELHTISVERNHLRDELGMQKPPAPAAPNVKQLAAHKTYGGELERLIASTGVDINKLLGRYGSLPPGEGGPFVALGPAQDQARAQALRREELRKLAKSLPLGSPLNHYVLESGFGPRMDPFRHVMAFHPGLDLAAPYRSPVYSTAPGIVTFTGVQDGYGRMVEITHAHGIVTLYAHLHRILVVMGQRVKDHQAIGELGSTGRSTGPHVHYGVLLNGVPVDPEKFMEAGKGVQLISQK